MMPLTNNHWISMRSKRRSFTTNTHLTSSYSSSSPLLIALKPAKTSSVDASSNSSSRCTKIRSSTSFLITRTKLTVTWIESPLNRTKTKTTIITVEPNPPFSSKASLLARASSTTTPVPSLRHPRQRTSRRRTGARLSRASSIRPMLRTKKRQLLEIRVR